MISSFDDHPHPAIIQIPTGEAKRANLQVSSTFTGMEGKRLILESPARVTLGTAVSVEYNDAMFLGEVTLCRQLAEGSYRVEIFVEQILTGLQSLIALRDGLLSSGTPVKPQAFIPVTTRPRNQNN